MIRLPSHPGGSLIFSKAGGDNTALFDAYHPLYVHKMLRRFHIGVLRDDDEHDPTYPIYADDNQKGLFYHTVRARVESLLREKRVDGRVSAAMYIKTMCILVGYAASYYSMFYVDWNKMSNAIANTSSSLCSSFSFPSFSLLDNNSTNSFYSFIDIAAAMSWYAALFVLRCVIAAGPALSAIFFGFFQGEIGVSIQHDANHGCYSKSPMLSMIAGWTLDVAGASSFMWKQQHVVGHHAYTNVVDVGTSYLNHLFLIKYKINFSMCALRKREREREREREGDTRVCL